MILKNKTVYFPWHLISQDQFVMKIKNQLIILYTSKISLSEVIHFDRKLTKTCMHRWKIDKTNEKKNVFLYNTDKIVLKEEKKSNEKKIVFFIDIHMSILRPMLSHGKKNYLKLFVPTG